MGMPISPNYNTKTFADMFGSAQDFYEQCNSSDLELVITETECKNLFYLLYAQYGNSPIANLDETQWKYKVYVTIFTYGQEWSKKINIQNTLRNLAESDIIKRGESIFNQASNPSVAPSTGQTEELGYVDHQSVNKSTSSKITGYQFLWESLNSDMNNWFVKKFEPCFSKFINRNIGLVYCTPEDEEDDE